MRQHVLFGVSLKGNIFEIFPNGAALKEASVEVMKFFFLKTGDFSLDVIVQPPKHTFEIALFSQF